MYDIEDNSGLFGLVKKYNPNYEQKIKMIDNYLDKIETESRAESRAMSELDPKEFNSKFNSNKKNKSNNIENKKSILNYTPYNKKMNKNISFVNKLISNYEATPKYQKMELTKQKKEFSISQAINEYNNRKTHERISIRHTNYNGNFGDNSSDDNKSFGKTTKDEVFRRLYKSKKEEIIDEKLVKDNQVKFFELINDYLLLVIYANDGCSLLYKIDWNKSMKENISEISHKKWKADECRIIRIAKNIENIIGYSMYKPNNDIILIAETYPKKRIKDNHSII